MTRHMGRAQLSTDAIYVPPQRIGITEIGENDAIRVVATVEAACEVFALHDYAVAELVKHSNVRPRHGSSP